ncbi:hypothetical protein F2Q69_00026962 [Brassica cretica]|uniref:Uncharacterized protein n=1 Tax=Brassica cretica TaxID=69181 RepID=A0A8S9S202_BRACR|nr:hypothetical protein F2Q69_00026962 [Brassica cretica]
MAGTEFSDEPVFKLKLLVDKKKNKVVLAEIVKRESIRKKNQKSQPATIGCFNNLYKSAVDMSTEDFLTEPCRHILLNPINAKERECKSNDLRAYSNFYSLKCICGKFMEKEINTMEGCPKEIFGSGKKSFIILDNMEVGFCSIVLTLKALRGLGYTDLNKLDEMLVDVGTSFAGMLILFGYSFDGCVLDETELMYYYKDT